MEDLEVIDAFVNAGSKRAFGESLHVEGDVLMLDGWWHASLRVADDTFIVRNEEPPRDTTVLDDITRILTDKGLAHVGTDLPAITVLTYTQITLGYVSWNVWAPDLASGEAALAAQVNEESFLQTPSGRDPTADVDYSAELGGARRNAGLPPSIVLTVGLESRVVQPLEETLTDCRVESRAFSEITPDGCGALIPTLVLVDATEQHGLEWVMQLRSVACGRFLPVVAVTADAMTPLGADTAVSAAGDPRTWVEPIRNLLP